jgi:hypothetical protein
VEGLGPREIGREEGNNGMFLESRGKSGVANERVCGGYVGYNNPSWDQYKERESLAPPTWE